MEHIKINDLAHYATEIEFDYGIKIYRDKGQWVVFWWNSPGGYVIPGDCQRERKNNFTEAWTLATDKVEEFARASLKRKIDDPQPPDDRDPFIKMWKIANRRAEEDGN